MELSCSGQTITVSSSSICWWDRITCEKSYKTKEASGYFFELQKKSVYQLYLNMLGPRGVLLWYAR